MSNANETPQTVVTPVRGGIVCPRCKGNDWGTAKVRKHPGRVMRVRTCRGCFLRVRTRETIEAVIGG